MVANKVVKKIVSKSESKDESKDEPKEETRYNNDEIVQVRFRELEEGVKYRIIYCKEITTMYGDAFATILVHINGDKFSTFMPSTFKNRTVECPKYITSNGLKETKGNYGSKFSAFDYVLE